MRVEPNSMPSDVRPARIASRPASEASFAPRGVELLDVVLSRGFLQRVAQRRDAASAGQNVTGNITALSTSS